MNPHWTFFYYTAAFVIGMFSAGLATVAFLRTRVAVLRAYLMFYLSLTLTLAIDLFAAYAETNLGMGSPGSGKALNFAGIASSSILAWTFPVFIHALYDVPSSGRRNLAAGIMAIVRFFGICGIILSSGERVTATAVAFFHLFDLMLAGVMVYGAVISVGRFLGDRQASRRRTSGTMTCIFLILAAAALEDQVLAIAEDLWLYPLVYAVFGAFFSWHFLRKYRAGFSLTADAAPLIGASTPEAQVHAPDTEAALRESFRRYGISPREQEVLRLLLQGRTNVQIAEGLDISANTVKTHIGNIYGKVGVNRRYELISRFSAILPFS